MNKIELEIETSSKEQFKRLKEELTKEDFVKSGVEKVTIYHNDEEEEVYNKKKVLSTLSNRYVVLSMRLLDLEGDKVHKQKIIFGQHTKHTLQYIYKHNLEYVKDLMKPENEYAKHMERTSKYDIQAVYFRVLLEMDDLERKIKELV